MNGMQTLIGKILPGVGEMMNIHPLLVHFPIAMLSAFTIMELLGFILKKEELRIAATWMLYIGALGAAGAVMAGLWASSTVPHSKEIHAIILRHRNFGLTVLGLSLFLAAWRLKVEARFALVGQIVHLIAAVVMTISLIFGADLGGLMVYKYGVSVKAAFQAGSHEGGNREHEH